MNDERENARGREAIASNASAKSEGIRNGWRNICVYKR
jgi:hypothetical protein